VRTLSLLALLDERLCLLCGRRCSWWPRRDATSSRFSSTDRNASAAPLLRRQDIAGWEGSSQGLLRCGILTRLLTGLGQDRALGDVGSMSGLPESGHDWPIYELAVIFPGKFPAMAVRDRAPRTQRRCGMVGWSRPRRLAGPRTAAGRAPQGALRCVSAIYLAPRCTNLRALGATRARCSRAFRSPAGAFCFCEPRAVREHYRTRFTRTEGRPSSAKRTR
jgi:hypothetical protein